MDLSERRETYNGFGEALSKAVEMVVTPMVFAGLGHLVDRWLGLARVFTISLLVLAVVGMFVRTWLGYEAAMRAHEATSPWGTAPRREPG